MREVTRQDVEQLWALAVDGGLSQAELHQRATTLIERVNAENPIVNGGLLTLYDLSRETRDGQDTALREARDRWRRALVDFDRDPVAWLHAYHVRMLVEFAENHDGVQAREFGRKLVAQGVLQPEDVGDLM